MRKFWKRKSYSQRVNEMLIKADLGGSFRRGMEQADREMKAFKRGRAYERSLWEKAVRYGLGGQHAVPGGDGSGAVQPGVSAEDRDVLEKRFLDAVQEAETGNPLREQSRAVFQQTGATAPDAANRLRVQMDTFGQPYGVLSEEVEVRFCYHPGQTDRWYSTADLPPLGHLTRIHERRCPDCPARVCAANREAPPLPPFLLPDQ